VHRGGGDVGVTSRFAAGSGVLPAPVLRRSTLPLHHDAQAGKGTVAQGVGDRPIMKGFSHGLIGIRSVRSNYHIAICEVLLFTYVR
jgi:hypothetical protein